MGDDGAMQSAVCDCARGMYKCSHAAALAIFAMWQISSTDVECQWRKPGTSKVVQPDHTDICKASTRTIRIITLSSNGVDCHGRPCDVCLGLTAFDVLKDGGNREQ
ncbi:putative zinc-type alcohol dehydrogenase-like protein YjmD [Dissostichus eleginoides]|uniref:Zinc-type alcohol dehydrogenase-like protein YjmD n=1 Tax=Dissostichus eleginoides TaxID=100907 RepID=A0AAD9CIE1_DISEL|nr:putative zinc-type alcohol dehydrogenase-like protein YjmD [Dissostichus eleginoides]